MTTAHPLRTSMPHRFSAAGWIVPIALLTLWIIQWMSDTWSRSLSWDEAVYFSQVATDHVAADLAVQRSRVIAFVAWPVGLFTDSVLALRLYLLTAVTGAALWLGVELRRVGLWAQVALGAFLLSATPAFHAAELSPNLWVAIVALAVAVLVVFPRHVRRLDYSLLAATAGFLVWLRPPDGAVFLTSLAVVMLVRRPLRDLRRLTALTIGGLLGLGIWVADAVSRFGGLSAAVDDASNQVTAGAGFRLGMYADMLDGPLRGATLDGISIVALIPWLLIVAGSIVLIWRSSIADETHSPEATSFMWITLVGGSVLALEYLAITVSRSIRYIYPSWLLVSVGIGAGLAGMWTARRRVGVWALLALVVVSQFPTTRAISSREVDGRAQMVVAGDFLVAQSAGVECAAASEFGAPQVGFAGNCRVAMAADLPRAIAFLEDRAAAGAVAYLMLIGEPDDAQAAYGPFERVPIDGTRFWSVRRIGEASTTER